jgi:hypothetical protein
MLYPMFARLASWMALLARPPASKDAELLVLRQTVHVSDDGKVSEPCTHLDALTGECTSPLLL